MDIPYIRRFPNASQPESNNGVGESNPDPREATSETHVDEFELLKDLFFHSMITRKVNWAEVLSDKLHDSKFWCNVTHTLGSCVLKNVFNVGLFIQDQIEWDRTSGPGDCSGVSDKYKENYTKALQRHVSFLLLGGMIDNRIPGSLRLITRGQGYQFFEYRLNQLLNDLSNYDADAVCFNMKALRMLLPYVQEHQPVKLSTVTYRFITSRFWRFMWLDVGVSLKTQNCSRRNAVFSAFLELASVICYGTRSATFLKRLYTSCLKSIWDPILGVLSWSLDPSVLCRLVTFIADLLFMSFQDGCIQLIGQEFISVLIQRISKVQAHGAKYLELYNAQTMDERNEFYHHHARVAVSMLDSLLVFLSHGADNLELLYDLSSIGIAKMTLWRNAESAGPPVKFDYLETKLMPRILPCFNVGCTIVFQIDMPDLHVASMSVDFRYCQRCGVPSYCSDICSRLHWEAGHKEVCGFFRSLPTFARFTPPAADPDHVLINTFDENVVLQPILDKEGNVVTVF